MPNPFFSAMKGQGAPQGGGGNMLQQFQQFMNQHQGEDPNQLLQQLLTSGQVSQEQLNQAQQMKSQIEGPLSGLRSMFGF